MTINLNQLSWHQKDNQISTYYTSDAGIYTIRFTKSPENFDEYVQQLFAAAKGVTVSDDTWKITVELFDTAGNDIGWAASKDSSVESLTSIVSVVQIFESLIKPTSMVFVSPNTLFKKISKVFTTALSEIYTIVPVAGDVDSYLTFSKNVPASI